MLCRFVNLVCRALTICSVFCHGCNFIIKDLSHQKRFKSYFIQLLDWSKCACVCVWMVFTPVSIDCMWKYPIWLKNAILNTHTHTLTYTDAIDAVSLINILDLSVRVYNRAPCHIPTDASIELTTKPESNKFFYCCIDVKFSIFAWKKLHGLLSAEATLLYFCSLCISLSTYLFLPCPLSHSRTHLYLSFFPRCTFFFDLPSYNFK